MWIYVYTFCRKFGKLSQIRVSGGSTQIITILQRAGHWNLSRFITILQGGGGVSRDPKFVLRNIWAAPYRPPLVEGGLLTRMALFFLPGWHFWFLFSFTIDLAQCTHDTLNNRHGHLLIISKQLASTTVLSEWMEIGESSCLEELAQLKPGNLVS